MRSRSHVRAVCNGGREGFLDQKGILKFKSDVVVVWLLSSHACITVMNAMIRKAALEVS